MFATSLADTCPIFEGSVVNKLQQFLRTWFHIRGISSTSILIMVYLGAAISKNSRFGTFRIEDSSNNPVSRRGNDSTNDGFPMLSKYLNGMNMSWFLEKIRVVLYRILVQKRGDFRDSVCWCGHCWRHCWRHCWPHLASYFPGSWAESWVPPVLPGPPMMLRRELWFWTASRLPRRERVKWDDWGTKMPIKPYLLSAEHHWPCVYVICVYVFSAIVFSCLLQDFQLDFFRFFGCSS